MTGPLDALSRLYPADARPISSVEPIGNAGGLSGARLYRFRAGLGGLVARRWPVDGPTPAALESIHAHLRRAGDLGFVPVPLPTLDGRTVVELDRRAWEISPWMPGSADLGRPPTPDHLRLGFGGLAAFLNRVAEASRLGPSPGLIHRAADLRRLGRGDLRDLRAKVERAPDDPATSLALRWFDRAVAVLPSVLESTSIAEGRPLPLQPCLRDARPHHLLFEGGRLSGLVDFGSMGIDTVAGDLARLLGEGVGPDRQARSEALAAFEAIRPLSTDEHRAIGAFERANALMGPWVWIRWHYRDRRAFDEPDAVVRGLSRCLQRLDETP